MEGMWAVFRRELLGYFQTPVAYVFIAIFLMASGMFTFYIGNFFEVGKADLGTFFSWHPWLYLFLIPSLTMRLWAEERRNGSIELLLTLPLPLWQAVMGKFLAAWLFTGISLLGTMSIWVTVNYLGAPDNGVIVAGYIGSLLMAGGYLAIGSCLSALTRNQVIAFVLAVTVCFLFTISGFPMVINFFAAFLPQTIVETLSLFSFLTNFSDITTGVVEWRSLVYFVSLIAFFLFVNVVVLDTKKG